MTHTHIHTHMHASILTSLIKAISRNQSCAKGRCAPGLTRYLKIDNLKKNRDTFKIPILTAAI